MIICNEVVHKWRHAFMMTMHSFRDEWKDQCWNIYNVIYKRGLSIIWHLGHMGRGSSFYDDGTEILGDGGRVLKLSKIAWCHICTNPKGFVHKWRHSLRDLIRELEPKYKQLYIGGGVQNCMTSFKNISLCWFRTLIFLLCSQNLIFHLCSQNFHSGMLAHLIIVFTLIITWKWSLPLKIVVLKSTKTLNLSSFYWNVKKLIQSNIPKHSGCCRLVVIFKRSFML